MNQSMLPRTRGPDTPKMVPYFLPMVAQLENKCRECIPMPARVTEDFSSVTAMIFSNEEKILKTYFYEGLRDIDYAMSYYV